MDWLHPALLAAFAGSVLATVFSVVQKLFIVQAVGARPYGSDAHAYLLLSDVMRHNGHRLPTSSPLMIGSSPWWMPLLQSWLFSFLDRNIVDRVQAYIPIGFKALLTGFIGCVTGVTAMLLKPDTPAVAVFVLAFVAAALFGFAPTNRNANRANVSDFTFSPRALAACLSAISITLALLGPFLGWGCYVLAAPLFAMSIACSLFCIQTIVLVALPTFLILQLWWALVAVFAGGLIAWAAMGRYLMVMLQKHVEFSIEYARNYAERHLASVTSAISESTAVRALAALARLRFGEFSNIVRHDVVMRGILLYPAHVAAAGIMLFASDEWLRHPLVTNLKVLWGVSAAVFLVTSTRPVRFLGEGDRYLEYAGAVPATVLVVLWVLPGWAGDGFGDARVALVVLLFVAGAVMGDMYPAPVQQSSAGRGDLMSWLGQLAKDKTRLVVTPMAESFEIIYRTGHACVCQPQADKNSREILAFYPYANLDAVYLAKLGITHVVVRRDSMDAPGVESTVGASAPLYANDEFLVFPRVSHDVGQAV